MTPLELRCSALPLAFLCPGSVRREGLALDESGAEADLGHAAHEALAELAETGRADFESVDALARRHGVEAGDVRALLALGADMWRELRPSFPHARTELGLEYRDPGGGFVLTGHADVISWGERVIRIADWKTGRRDADYREQLIGYCVLAIKVCTAPRTDLDAEALALWVRDREVERHAMRGTLAEAWLARVDREIVNWDGRYRVGPHCQHCPRSHECPAGRALVRRDVARLIADAELAERLADDALEALAPSEIVALLARADLAVDVGHAVRSAIRGYVQRRGDVTGGGHRLTMEGGERRDLDLLAAFPVLVEAGLGDDELAEVLTASIAAAERVVARMAGRGKGAAAKRRLVEALDRAGAIKTTATARLVVKRDTTMEG